MGVTLRWVGEEALDRVAETRLKSYATVGQELDLYRNRIREDTRAKPGDFLLAEENGQAVGTTTSIPYTMWVRGNPLPCQGVAWVGTIKTHRRRTTAPSDKGIASRLMNETLRLARERGQVLSALMPFRASFYEHFGYGIVEQENEWTIPLSILPRGDCSGMEFMRPEDLPLIYECRQRMVRQGQCDLERSPESWRYWARHWADGFCVVDRSGPAIHSWMHLKEVPRTGQVPLVRVADACWDSPQAMLKQLHFLASLRDQYDTVNWLLSVDLPLNRLLSEPQVPHRPVPHATAKVSTNTRMQVRILDHIRFLESLTLPADLSAQAKVSIIEPEGEKVTLHIELNDRRLSAKRSTGEPGVVCAASTWASIACGDLLPTAAICIPGMTITDRSAIKLLSAFSAGPRPFCSEYF